MQSTYLSFLCLFIWATGCADQSVESSAQETITIALAEGSPEAIGLLEFLNEPSTTLELLDDEVPLNRRTARNLILHRDGWDQTPGTYDDNLFDTVSEVDEVRWVGPAALAQLLKYALDQGWIPDEDDLLGSWDGVDFTVSEAELTLSFVNAASHDLLDHDLGLDRRAADSIVEAQPIESIEELAGLYYVGGTALSQLKEHALSEDVVEYLDQFNHDEAEELPDGSSAGLTTKVHVVGVPDIAVDVVFVVDLQHDAPEEVQLTLTSPSGTSWVIEVDGPSIAHPLGSMFDPNGYWTLNAVDSASSNVGEVYGWALEVSQAKATPSAESLFASDLSEALVGWYATHGADVEAMGANSLVAAQAAVSSQAMSEVLDPEEDPHGHDLSTTQVLSHPDMIFPGGDAVWFAAYDRKTMTLLEVYSFE